MNIEEFCTKHDACTDGKDWALANCKDMNQVWETAPHEWLTWVAVRNGVLTDKELRLFAVFCARQVEHLMIDQSSKDAIIVAERHALGLATDEELYAARAAAWAASRDAAGDAAWAAQSGYLRANCKPNFEV